MAVPIRLRPISRAAQDDLWASISVSDLDSGCRTVDTGLSQHSEQSANLCPLRAVTLMEGINLESLSMMRVDSVFHQNTEDGTDAIPRPGAHGPAFLQTSRSSCQHFVEVSCPKKWALPLLRLTPVSQSFQRLDSLPFVSALDTPFRLPGPSMFPTSCF